MDGRATFLPFKDSMPNAPGSVMNQRALALPAILAGAWNAFTAPERARTGQLDPNSEQAILEAMNVAGMAMLPGVGKVVSGSKVPHGQVGANVYHGSPHKFDAFDAAHIGKGEGAQAYGHGLYLAENPAVAKNYMQAGGPGKFLTLKMKDGTEIYGPNLTQAHLDAAKALDIGKQQAGEFPHNTAYYAKKNSPSAEVTALIDKIESSGYKSQANLYKVDLPDEMISKMMDWDKPLSQQPELIKKLEMAGVFTGKKKLGPAGSQVENFIGPNGVYVPADQPAQRAYIVAQQVLGADKASQVFRDAGVAGIRYLDQGSRAGGKGTYNYVVFPGEEKALKILGRE
jgi:hypothetical protein